MKRFFIVSLIVLFAAAVWSEDLAEVAKKEKERREALKKQGKKATVLTNQDVKNIKSSLGIESTLVEGTDSAPVEETDSAPSDSAEPAAAAVVKEAIDDSNASLEELRQQKAELTKNIQETSDSIQQSGAHSSNIGERYREKRLKEEELRKVEEQIEELEKGTKETTEEQTEKQEENN